MAWAHKRSSEYGADWQRMRASVLARDAYLCQVCKRMGRLTPGCREVDHIAPVSRGGTMRPDNLQTICRACHALKTRREQSNARPVYGCGPDGMPVDSGHPWGGEDGQ